MISYIHPIRYDEKHSKLTLFVVKILGDLALDKALDEPEVSLLDVDIILVNKILQKHRR
jgi:hypothetical protein